MTDYAPGHSSWRRAVRRVAHGLLPGRDGPRRGWSLGVPVIAVAAGLLFTTSATTAGDLPLREDRQLQLPELIEVWEDRVAAVEAELEPLQEEVAGLTDDVADEDRDPALVEQQERAESYREAAGFTPLRGPGVTVVLDDAVRPDGVRPPSAEPDDLLVHQQDVQAVVNALWAGGAEAMAIMGERVIATSAVLCVGPVLLLHGRPYSPPYEITAVGDPGALTGALDASPGVRLFQEAADAYGLGYGVTVEEGVAVPAFEGTSTLRWGRVPE